MRDTTFVKLCVVEPSQPFITEVRGPFTATVWDSIVKAFEENPDEIAGWNLPPNTVQVWCVIDSDGSGSYDDPRYWYLVPVKPLRYETLPAHE